MEKLGGVCNKIPCSTGLGCKDTRKQSPDFQVATETRFYKELHYILVFLFINTNYFTIRTYFCMFNGETGT